MRDIRTREATGPTAQRLPVDDRRRRDQPLRRRMARAGGGWTGDLRAALPAWLAARVLVLLSFVLAKVLVERFDLVEAGHRFLADGLVGWDGRWYERIAQHGYGGLPREGLRFFPLLPSLARALAPLTGGRADLALVLVGNASALAFGALLHRLCLRERRDQQLARRATWLVAFTPAAFVLSWGYSEGLIGCLAVGTFLLARGGRWWPAAATGLLAGLTRPVGVLLVLPVAWEALRPGGSVRGRALPRLAAVAAPGVGLALYLGWVGLRFGNPLLPLSLQQAHRLRGELASPLPVFTTALERLLQGKVEGNALPAFWAVCLVGLVVVLWRRWPAAYTLLAAASLLVALSTTRLGSFERYTFGTFPVVLALASLTGDPRVERGLLVLLGGAMLGYCTLAFLGAYVP